MDNKNRYALISVFDKTGIVEFARVIQDLGYKIISTVGTARVLKENKINVIPIEQITGNPESFDGRMKTISFEIESGILFDRSNPSHVKQTKELNIKPIDLVVCNLYPFEKTIQKSKASLDDAIENIDVGGPTMIRAAAKNFKNVIIIVDPKDYQLISNKLIKNTIDEKLRQTLAAKAFYHLSFYDSQIANYFNREQFPEELTIPGRRFCQLRYGENPHQKSSLYVQPNAGSIFQNTKKLWGRELSLVNVIDINAGIESVRLFKQPCAVVIKHANPCGIALAKNQALALKRAIEADPESAFGGVIVLNKKIDLQTAMVIGDFKDEKKSNIDIVAIPSIENKALKYLKEIRKSMGIYVFGKFSGQRSAVTSQLNIKFVDGGFIVQNNDVDIEQSFKNWQAVTKIKPTKKQLGLAKIGWLFISRIKSNAVIVIDEKLPMTRGIGSGQTSRVRATRISLGQAGRYAKGGILVSDSFFPFDDSIKLAAKAGIKLVIQQGGSINDGQVIKTADELGVAMIFTNRRAFWH